MRRLRKLGLVGVGLIGGSLALALKRANAVAEIAAFDRDRAALARAAELGVIDSVAESASETASAAEVVVVAVPVRAIGSVLHDVALTLDRDAVITDVGSTKADVVRTARAELRERIDRFVPGHPIAGRETSGVESAAADLFRNARVTLTPVPETDRKACDLVRTLWEAAGARVTTLSPEDHDRIFAAVSHLPHLLSFALVSEIASRVDSQELFGFAAGGFRDFTRIAASSPEMWRDIALQNRDALLEELDRYGVRLAVFRELIAKGDGQGLERLMTEARASRQALATPRRGPTE
ncbi:MAG: prephenate dehydrogenase [Bacillota bacterium]